MRIVVTQEVYDQLTDPSKRDPEREARRLAALARGRACRQRSLERIKQRSENEPPTQK